MTKLPHVHILMATFNGASFLQEQLRSLLAQSHRNWSLWVSDDGSTDATRRILRDFQRAHPQIEIHIFDGPCAGYAQNFLSLLRHPDLPKGYVALSDQDDVWLPHKLERALRHLTEHADQGVALYGSRTRIVDEWLNDWQLSPAFGHPPSFTNALVQNIMGGNTQVLSPAAVGVVQSVTDVSEVFSHDWWLYQLITGCGGKVIFDRVPGLLYRQHSNNAVGANLGTFAKLRRIGMVLKGRFRHWINENIRVLHRVSALLTPENRLILDEFRLSRHQRGLVAWASYRRLGLSRQTVGGNISLFLAATLGKI